ncbi:hypothetical protein AB9E23_17110 [Rhizobium leguminosarum]
MNIAANVGPALAFEVADADSIAELRHQAEGCTRCGRDARRKRALCAARPRVKLTPERGHILYPANRPPVLVTIHPSYLLRIRDKEDQRRQRRDFVSDLHKAAEFRPPVKADSQP